MLNLIYIKLPLELLANLFKYICVNINEEPTQLFSS